MVSEVEGKVYLLRNYNSDETQKVIFTHKSGDQYVPGTTNEEVLDMLIDRLYKLSQGKFDSNNSMAISHLKSAKASLKKRSSKKKLKYKSNDGSEG